MPHNSQQDNQTTISGHFHTQVIAHTDTALYNKSVTIMKIQTRQRRSKKSVLVAIVALLLLATLTFGALEYFGVTHVFTPAENSSQPTAEDKALKEKVTNDESIPTTSTQSSVNSSSKKDTTTTPGTYTPPTTNDGISIDASQQGQSVIITTQLVGYSDGTCSLTITNGTNKTTQSAPVMYQAQASTCAGFSVPVSSIGAGTWKIDLSIQSGGKTTQKGITFEAK